MFMISIADRIATLTLSRPPVNAINEEWVRLLASKSRLEPLHNTGVIKMKHLKKKKDGQAILFRSNNQIADQLPNEAI